MEFLNGQTERSTKASIRMIRKKGRVLLLGLMADFIPEVGLVESNMEWVNSKVSKGNYAEVCGITAGELSG